MGKRTEVGKTADAGYQVGVRRTLPCSEERLWRLLLSPAGLETWLGGPAEIAEGVRFRLDNGTTGEIRVYRPGSHIRLGWRPAGWGAPSTLQVRVMAARRGTTLSFHQEHLAGAAERAAMKAHWEGVIGSLAGMLPGGGKRPGDDRPGPAGRENHAGAGGR